MAASRLAPSGPRRARAFGASCRRSRAGGFSLVELIVGVAVGAIALAMVFAMFVGSSAAIRDGNNRAMAVGQVEVALQRLVREIKYANSTNPDPTIGMSDVISNALPMLPYTGSEIYPYSNFADSSGALYMPAVPAARLFSQQVGASPLAGSRWCPNPDISGVPTDASNSLVYFYAPPSEGGTMHRITLRLDTTDLVRMDQSPVTATSYTDTTAPVAKRQVMMRGVTSVQFTYPSLLAVVNGTGATAFDAQLSGMTAADRATFLNKQYRRLIGIRLRVAVVSESGGRQAISELRTSVQVRN